jgi:putative Mg2+ transporter-C (MgtC) family protein
VPVDLEWDVAGRLLMGALLGAIVGLEREYSDQAAGLRTHLTVAVGAALFGVISTTGFTEFETTQSATNIQFDVTRVASLVVSGIGFLGAGLVFRRGTAVHNLTTAASVWAVAAIGLSCGVGDFWPGVVTTVITIVALSVLRLPRTWIRTHVRPDSDVFRIVLHQGVPDTPVMHALEELPGITVRHVALEKDGGAYVLSGELRAARSVDLRASVAPISRRDDVATLRLGGGADE